MDEKVMYILKHPATLPTVVGTVTFGLGMGVGFLLGKKRAAMLDNTEEDQYLDVEEDLGIEGGFEALRERISASDSKSLDELTLDSGVIMDANQYVAAIRQAEKQTEEFEDLDDEDDEEYDVGPDILDAMEEIRAETKEEEIQVIRDNIFAQSGDDWDYDTELEVRLRHPLEPHVLHYDEFWANEAEETQHTLTYYSQDDILADEDNAPIFNHHEITGELMFGKGSKNDDTVYIRNPKNHAIYEILRINKMYSEEVMGLEVEDSAREQDLRHSASPGKFRPDD